MPTAPPHRLIAPLALKERGPPPAPHCLEVDGHLIPSSGPASGHATL